MERTDDGNGVNSREIIESLFGVAAHHLIYRLRSGEQHMELLYEHGNSVEVSHVEASQAAA